MSLFQRETKWRSRLSLENLFKGGSPGKPSKKEALAVAEWYKRHSTCRSSSISPAMHHTATKSTGTASDLMVSEWDAALGHPSLTLLSKRIPGVD
jgi:hypothetical protein